MIFRTSNISTTNFSLTFLLYIYIAKPAVEKAAKAVLAADEVQMADEAAEQLQK